MIPVGRISLMALGPPGIFELSLVLDNLTAAERQTYQKRELVLFEVDILRFKGRKLWKRICVFVAAQIGNAHVIGGSSALASGIICRK